ncbi:hypothetical protein H1R20_g411, partial [Candolleomyces eurysporus]
MDLQFDHPTQIYALRACHTDDATDLVAIAGSHSLQVVSIQRYPPSAVTAGPLSRLAVATEDFGLHLLSKSSTEAEYIYPFGGSLSGHHGLINDMTFCGGWSEDSSRYLATVSDDKMLMVWDLHPPAPARGARQDNEDGMDDDDEPRPQPTAYVIPFPHPLTSISSHPHTSKEFLVSDCRGSVYLTDWRSDPVDIEEGNLRHSSLVELVEPYALSASCMGHPVKWSGSTAWRSDSVDIIGGVFGTRFSIWDLSNMRGGKPAVTAQGTLDGGYRFRWCRTYPEHFGISTQSPTRGATIQVHNTNFVQAQPTVFTLRQRPQFVCDFDFLSLPGIPRIAAAVGKSLLVFPIGEESS